MSAQTSTAHPQHEDITPARQQELSRLKETIKTATAIARNNGTRVILRNFQMPLEWMSADLREYFSRTPQGLFGDLLDHSDKEERIDSGETQVQTSVALDALDNGGIDDYLLDTYQDNFSSVQADNHIMEDTAPDMAMSGIEEEALNLEKALLASKVPTTEAASIDNGREPSPQDEESKAYDTDEMELSDPDQDSDMDDNFFFGDEDNDDNLFFGDGNDHNDQGNGDKGQAGDEDSDESEGEDEAEVIQQGEDRLDFEKEKLDLERRYDSGERQLVVPMQGIFKHVEVTCEERGLSIKQAHTVRFNDKGVDMTLEETLPIARKYDDDRSWMYDNMVEYLVDENGPYPPGTAFISTGMNQLYLGTGQLMKAEEVNDQLEEHVRRARSNASYVPVGIWPFDSTAANVRKAVMAWNPKGSHWVCVSFCFDEASSKGRVEVRNSWPSPRGDNGELRGTDKAAVTYLRAFGELMAISPFVNLPYLTWNDPVQLVEQTRQSNTIDCGPIAVDTIVKELHGRPNTIVRGFAEAQAFGLELRTRILKSVYEKILGQNMPVFYDNPHATGRATTEQTYDFNSDEDMAIDPELLQEQGLLLKIAAMEKDQRGKPTSGPKVSSMPPKVSSGHDEEDSDIEELEKGADGSFKPVSVKVSSKMSRDKIDIMTKLVQSVGQSVHATTYGAPLKTLLGYITLYPGIESKWILGFEQMCRFMPPMGSKKSHSHTSAWYSESMVNAVVTLARSPDGVSHFVPVQDVQSIIADDVRERFMSHVESGSTDPYPRMASLSQAPKNAESVVFAWLALGHWTTVYVQHPQTRTVGHICHFDSMVAERGTTRLSLARKVLPAFVAEYARELAWPEVRWEVQPGISNEQKDSSSCGPLAADNCVKLLRHGSVTTEPNDTNALRLRHFQLAYRAIADTQDDAVETLILPGQEAPNYRELLCNALEDGDATEEELFGLVKTQLEPEVYEGDDLFDRRLSYYLRSTPTTFAESSGKWSLIHGPGHNLSTNERLRLESLESPSRVLDVLDYLDNEYCLIVVAVRTSRGYLSRAISDRSKNLAVQIAQAFWLRFVSSNTTLTLVNNHQDWAAIDHVSQLPFFELVLDKVSSSETLLSMIKHDYELFKILDSVQGRVVILQANPDGTSTDLDSFSRFLTKWPRTNLDLMIYTSLRQESLLNWGVPDNEMLWYQLNLNRLVALWQRPAANTLSMQERLINNGHEQMLYMMHVMHCAKLDHRGEGMRVRCKPWRSNGVAMWFRQFRMCIPLPEGTKSCEDCGSETTSVAWKRGSSVHGMPTLRCDGSHLSSPDVIADFESNQAEMYALKDKLTKESPHMSGVSGRLGKLTKPRKSGGWKGVDLCGDQDVPSNLFAATSESRALAKNPAYKQVVTNKEWQSGLADVSIGATRLPHTAGMFIRRKIYKLEGTSSPVETTKRSSLKYVPLWLCEPCGRKGKSFRGMIVHYLTPGHLAVVNEQAEVKLDSEHWVPMVEASPPYGHSPHVQAARKCLIIDGKPHAILFICNFCGYTAPRISNVNVHRCLAHKVKREANDKDDDSNTRATEAFAAIVKEFEIFRAKYESEKGADN